MVNIGKLSLTRTQTILLLSPPVLLITTYITYGLLGELLGSVNGYLGGFLFYWIVWCCILPVLLLGFKQIRNMFNDSEHRFGKPRLIGLAFLAGPFVAPFFSMFLPKIGEASLSIIIVSALFAIVNGTMEELLWRGAFGFATMSIFMGLTFGWVAKKSNSIRWTTLAHILTDFMGLAGFAFIGGGF